MKTPLDKHIDAITGMKAALVDVFASHTDMMLALNKRIDKFVDWFLHEHIPACVKASDGLPIIKIPLQLKLTGHGFPRMDPALVYAKEHIMCILAALGLRPEFVDIRYTHDFKFGEIHLKRDLLVQFSDFEKLSPLV